MKTNPFSYIIGPAVVIHFASLIACAQLRPTKGDQCAPGAAVCQADGSSVQCQNGVYVAIPCPGPKSCSMVGGHHIFCDQTAGVTAGMACPSSEIGMAQCAADLSAALKCDGEKWVPNACPNSCAIDVGNVVCR